MATFFERMESKYSGSSAPVRSTNGYPTCFYCDAVWKGRTELAHSVGGFRRARIGGETRWFCGAECNRSYNMHAPKYGEPISEFMSNEELVRRTTSDVAEDVAAGKEAAPQWSAVAPLPKHHVCRRCGLKSRYPELEGWRGLGEPLGPWCSATCADLAAYARRQLGDAPRAPTPVMHIPNAVETAELRARTIASNRAEEERKQQLMRGPIEDGRPPQRKGHR